MLSEQVSERYIQKLQGMIETLACCVGKKFSVLYSYPQGLLLAVSIEFLLPLAHIIFPPELQGSYNILCYLKITIICWYNPFFQEFACKSGTGSINSNALQQTQLLLADAKFYVFGPIHRNIKHQYLQKIVTLRYVDITPGLLVCFGNEFPTIILSMQRGYYQLVGNQTCLYFSTIINYWWFFRRGIRHIYISELFSMYSRNIRDSGELLCYPTPSPVNKSQKYADNS